MNFKNFAENKLIVLAFVFALVLHVSILLILPYPVVPDVFERLRVTEHLLENGSFPNFDPLIAPNGVHYLYPPLTDLFLAFGSTMFFSSPVLVWKILSFILFVVFLFFSLKFSTKYLSKNQQVLMIFFLAFAPVVVVRFVSYVAETVGLAFFPVLFFLIFKRKFWLAGLLFGVLGLTHFRTFFTVFGIIGFFALFSLSKNQKENFFGSLKTIIVGVVLCSPFYFANFSKIIAISSFTNPFVSDTIFIALGLLGVPIVLFALLSIPFLKKTKFDSLFISMIAVPIFFLTGVFFSNKIIVFAYRESAFIVLPLAILASISFSKIYLLIKQFYLKIIAVIILFALFSLLFVVLKPAFSTDDEKTMMYLNANVPKGELVLSDYVFGYWLEYSGFSIVAGPFIERIPDAEKRLFLLNDFFEGKNLKVLQEFSPKCIVFRNKEPKKDFVTDFEKVFVSGKNSVYCKK